MPLLCLFRLRLLSSETKTTNHKPLLKPPVCAMAICSVIRLTTLWSRLISPSKIQRMPRDKLPSRESRLSPQLTASTLWSSQRKRRHLLKSKPQPCQKSTQLNTDHSNILRLKISEKLFFRNR